jgi:hypothetical protein
MELKGLYNMNKKRMIGEGFAVETHGRASLSTMGREMCGGAALAGMARETHGRASLRAMSAEKGRGRAMPAEKMCGGAMPAGKTGSGAFLRAMPAGKTGGGAFLRAMPAGKGRGRAFLAGMAGKMCGGACLLVAMLLLFAGCEKEVGGGVGKKVEVVFSADVRGYQGGGSLGRSTGVWGDGMGGGDVRGAKSRRVYVNDSIYLRFTLRPDMEGGTAGDGGQLRDAAFMEGGAAGDEGQLRAEPFISGQKLCFAAYLADGSTVGSAVYTYSGGGWVADNNQPLEVDADNSTVYRFVAYSHFGSTTTPSTTGLDPSEDLVWNYAEKKIEDTAEGRKVSINMEHLFARVKVRVNSDIEVGGELVKVSELIDVEVVGEAKAAFDPFDGSFGAGTAPAQFFDFDTSTPAAVIDSDWRTVLPVTTEPTTVKLGKISVVDKGGAGYSVTDQTILLDSELEAGKSYILQVDLKKVEKFVWAKSNIYWDGQAMTFVRAESTDNSKQGYQGLFFRCGGLKGTGTGTWTVNNTPIYEVGKTTPGIGAWASVSSKAGDICKEIDPDYRLPAPSKFKEIDDWEKYDSETEFLSITTDKTDGTYDFIANGNACVTSAALEGIILPPSGTRTSNNGGLTTGSVGTTACYWTSSWGTSGNTASGLVISSGGVSLNNAQGPGIGGSVRCVKKGEGEEEE